MTYRVRSVLPMRTAKTGYLAVSLLFALAGIFLVMHPDVSAAVLGRIAGGLLVLFGIFRLIGYFSGDLYRLAFQFDLLYGTMLIVTGAAVLIRPQHMLDALSILTGICVTADGLMKLRIARDAKLFGIPHWWIILSAAALTVLLGVLLLLRPSESIRFLMQLIGAVLLAEGILNLITALMTVKIVHNQHPDIIPAEIREEHDI